MILPPVPCPVLRDTRHGHAFVETSDEWNRACQPLPCFASIYWPGYATKVIKQKIGGVDAVVQLWKGLCPTFLMLDGEFPGGFGAEVGIYRLAPEGAEDPANHPQAVAAPARSALPRPSMEPPARIASELPGVAAHVVERVSRDIDRTIAGFRHPIERPATAGEVWYPAPELRTKLWFRLVNPKTSPAEEFFQTPPDFRDRTGYWCNRWMEKASYDDYQSTHETPGPTGYVLEYTIDGESQKPW
jgi:hypothetical protein